MKITIKVKLLLGFFLVAFLAAVIGYMGASNLKETNSSYEDVWKNYGMSFVYMGKVESDFHQTRLEIRNLLLTTDSRENEIIMGRIKGYREVVNKYMGDYEKTCNTDEEKKMLANMKEKLGKARDLR